MSAQKCDTICLPRELVEEMLIRFIWGLCSAQNALVSAPQTQISCDDLETIIATNDEMINYLFAYFPTEEDREQIIVAVKEKTGFWITKDFFAGEPSLSTDLVGKTYLDS